MDVSSVLRLGVNGYRKWPYLRDEQREWSVV
ncbi:MAG: hypothetical protein QOF37_1441, partial [Thermoleophilaceae bacterium]|nr:hypothetical protein [Thermoleophilaceae bacterium]